MTTNKFWNFIKNEAAPDEVELRIDGDIVDDEFVWIYEWFGLPATSPNLFREELREHAGKNITVSIDSWGGSSAAAAGNYDALKNHDCKVTVKITKAVSAASVIAMSGDEVWMSPVGVFMIHNPWTEVAGEARELRRVADVLDVIKETIVNAYRLKTGKSRAKIAQMMDEETWMSARTAKAEGFADGILYAAGSPAQAAENSFTFSRLAIQNSASADMKRFIERYRAGGIAGLDAVRQTPPPEPVHTKANPPPAADPQKESILAGARKVLTAAWQSFSFQNRAEEEHDMPDIKNVDDLKEAFPDLVNQIEAQARADAVKAEQGRVAALDALDDGTNPTVTALVADAKAAGKTADDIKAAVEIVRKTAPASSQDKGKDWLKSLAADTKNSGVDGVAADTPGGQGDDSARAADMLTAAIKNQQGGNR